MTDTEIFEVAKSFAVFGHGENWEFWQEDLLKFAKAIYEKGYNQSYDDSKSSSFKGFHNCLDD
jgi:hypothetical protein